MSRAVEQCGEDAVETEEAFRARMERQCYQIEQYRLALLRESGILLSKDEAALEWIERFAATFDGGANTACG